MSGFANLLSEYFVLEPVMARRPRVHFPGALYHVISRGNQRQKIYKDDPDYQRFETLLGEVIKRHALTLYAYVLMPNHFHLLVEVGRVPLSKAMQVLLYRLYPPLQSALSQKRSFISGPVQSDFVRPG